MARDDSHQQLMGDWMVDAIGGEPVDPQAPRTVRFEEGRMTGNVGVNRFTGSYTIEVDTLEVGGLASTRMAGPPDLMDLENRFNSHMPGEHKIDLSGDDLVLSQGDRSIHLTRAPELSVDGDWLVVAIGDEPVDPGAPRALRFEEGRVTGRVGVNHLTGSYTFEGDLLDMGQAATTLMAGPPRLTDLEDRFASFLQGEHQVRVEGDHLVLSRGHDSVRLTRAPEISVQGTVTYRERIMLPPGSVVTVDLIDISVADTAVETIASQMIADALGPPIPFSLAGSQAIDQIRRLAVRARIVSQEGDLLWATDSPAVVTTTDEPIELFLRRPDDGRPV